ncbi:MAG: DeoR/GlpR transcriptional regulator, partial [Firmicutes bacterium]|nr:DeoR/GlpR transcriptional regulator [Bacillota bacterium]
AYSKPNAEIIVLPGILNRRTNSLADVSTLEFLGRYHFSKVFMAATGISTDGKLNVKTYLEYEIKQLAMKQSETHILMCDASKYGSNGLMSYATLTDVDTLVTDDTCPEDLRILCAQTGTELIIAR